MKTALQTILLTGAFVLLSIFPAGAQSTFLGKNYTIVHSKISNTEGGLSGNPFASKINFGNEVECIGDIDSNGVADLVVCADRDYDGSVEKGAIYILLMNSDNTVKKMTRISGTDSRFNLSNGSRIGLGLSALGDVDGDGVMDIAAGAPADNGYMGCVYVIFLKSDGTVKSVASKIDDKATNFKGLLGYGDIFGHSTAALGDVNGDGVPDLGIGAPGSKENGVSKGAAYIIFLKSDGSVKNYKKIDNTTTGIKSMLDAGDNFGITMNGIGDLDGDGIKELAIGASNDDDAVTDGGAVYCLYLDSNASIRKVGKINGKSKNFNNVLYQTDYFGVSVSRISALSSSGKPLIAVGAYNDDDKGYDRGAVYLIELDTPFAVSNYLKISARSPYFGPELEDGDRFGVDVADFYMTRNDTPYYGFAAGAFADDDGYANSGAVYLFLLKDTSSGGSASIWEQFSKHSFSIYPNPSGGVYNLTAGRSMQNLRYTVTDVAGRVVEEQLVPGFTGRAVVDISGRSGGIYFIRVSAEGILPQTYKVVKE